jgi:hypothetical protein
MKDRLKEIKHRKYEICVTIKELKQELVKLSNEEAMINGYHRIERSKESYRKKGKHDRTRKN